MNAIEYFENKCTYEEIKVEGNSVSIDGSGIQVLSRASGRYKIRLLKKDIESGDYVDRYDGLKEISFPLNFDNVDTILGKQIQLNYKTSYLNPILDLTTYNYREIKLLPEDGIKEKRGRVLRISMAEFVTLVRESVRLNNKANSHKNKFVKYHINKIRSAHFNIETRPRTLTSKGDFKFLIDRFALGNKNSKRDFESKLNQEDLGSIQELCDKLIKHEVFNPEYLQRLDDYFIKQKLKDVIGLGREIIDIGSTNLDTDKAVRVIEKVSPGEEIAQLETLWQRYFERNLLYLIFSYRKIYSKVRVNTPDGVKYPDFVGVNHYGGIDIIEIKTHLKNALSWDNSHENFSFSSEMSKAVIQTMNYMDAIVQEKVITEHNEVNIIDEIKQTVFAENLYRPRGIIIISSKDKLVSRMATRNQELVKRDFTKLRNGLNNIEVLTFDEIIDTAERYSQNIVGKENNGNEN